MCQKHYDRLRNRGTVEPLVAPSPAERIAAHVAPGADGCIEWTGKVDRKGYGRISIEGRQFFAHRVTWELANGPIPDGMCVCHHCDNPPCCNVAHLFLGTIRDNNLDMSAKGRNHNQRKTHCPRGHEYTPENVFINPGGGRKCRTCGIAASTRWLKRKRESSGKAA
jgi:hypothetical protein